jgi:hypothetical protein
MQVCGRNQKLTEPLKANSKRAPPKGLFTFLKKFESA